MKNGYAHLTAGAVVDITKYGFHARGKVVALLDNQDGTSTVTLDGDYAIPPGCGIGNPGDSGAGYKILNCSLGGTRSRAIIAKADNGLIKGNWIAGVLSPVVLIGDESAGHDESGFVTNVVIMNNTIQNYGTKSPAIEVSSAAGVSGNGNIKILHNTITGTWTTQIVLQGLDTGLVEGNAIDETSPVEAAPSSPVQLVNCRKITFLKNRITSSGLFQPVPYVSSGSDSSEVTGSKTGFTVLTN